MNRDFLRKQLLDLRAPGFKGYFAGQEGAVDPHAKRQRMLVLPRQWNQIFIA